ncbi:MAG: transglycosylase domain-containing protein [Burkholderiaceae bacterium]|nr:transglycosylase domain-containing protein [Burkholderiaceae bacterium]
MERLKALYASALERLRHPTPKGIALGVAAVPVALLIYVLALIPFTPSIADLQKVKVSKPSVVMSADGQELAVFRRTNREWVKLSAISPYVVEALIATEDRRFYEHHGIDILRTTGALFNSFTGNLQGGSTITQQLARNLFPDDIGRAPTLTRKIKEAITALKIEAVYSKDEILETYLNTVPFLYNAWGIEVAARTYFDKSAGTLDVLESATLVGMLKGTSYYNPVLNPERSTQRRNTVLTQLARSGKLTPATLERLKNAPLKVDFERQNEQLGAAPHLTAQLRKWLIDWADRNNYNIFADGLVVRTTIDSRLQDMATKALTAQAGRLQQLSDAEWGQAGVWKAKGGPRKDAVLAFVRESKEYKAARAGGQGDDQAIRQLLADADFVQALKADKTRLQAAFMALDPSSGQVRAWVGSRDFTDDQFDHVQQARRQPGSTFKPFVYGAAFLNGSKPTDTFVDGDVEIPLGDGTVWRPTDGGGASGATMTLREGLMYSKNTITAQVMQTVGAAKVAQLAKAMGVRQSKLDEVPSLALGTSPVTHKEMVTAYGTIANDGRYIEPVMITQVEDRNGTVLERFEAKAAETAMPVETTQTLLDVMRGVIGHGTGAGIRSRFGIKADVAGKTGTTQNNTDAWFILMHPQLVAGAWVGYNDNRVTMGSRWGQGAQAALPIVGEVFRVAIKGKVIDGDRQFAAPRVPPPPPPAEPMPESGTDSILPGAPGFNGGNYNNPGELGPQGSAQGNVQGNVQSSEGYMPEGSWRPAQGSRYVTIQQLPAQPQTGGDAFAPRVLSRPDGQWVPSAPAPLVIAPR